jgi:hypothetical protein
MATQLKNMLVTMKPPSHFRSAVLEAWKKRKETDRLARETAQVGLVAFFAVVAGLALMLVTRRANGA